MSAIGDWFGDTIFPISEDILDKLFKNTRMATRAEVLDADSREALKWINEDYLLIRDMTVDALDELNKRKIKIRENEIRRFVECYKQIGNIDYNECNRLTDLKSVKFTKPDYEKMCNTVLVVEDQMKSFKIITGRKAKISVNNARANAAAAKIEIEKLETEKVELEAIRALAKQEDKVIRKLTRVAREPLGSLVEIVAEKTDWNVFTLDEKKTVARLMGLMKLIKLLIDEPVITSDGEINNKAYSVIGHEEIEKLTQKENCENV